MSLCTCPERPRCGWRWCLDSADWSVRQPKWGKDPERFTFMCEMHSKIYRDAMTKPMLGIDRPNADEDWHGSIMEHIRHAQIAIAFENRNEKNVATDDLRRPGDDKSFTPAQQQQIMILRKRLREMGPNV